MELKVWVEGIQRIVCGVTDTTTCQDVVFALAHATGKSGRFTLIERWRNNERQLSPQENPLKILMKWGEYSNDVQFILQWNESSKSQSSVNKNKFTLPLSSVSNTSSPNTTTESIEKLKDSTKPVSFSSPRVTPTTDTVPPTSPPTTASSTSTNVGVVKGVQQLPRTPPTTAALEVRCSYESSPPKQQQQQHSASTSSTASSMSPMGGSGSGGSMGGGSSQATRVAPPYKEPPAPPPYRDPPPPSASSAHQQQQQQQQQLQQQQQQMLLMQEGGKYRRNVLQENKILNEENKNKFQRIEEPVVYNTQYRELVNLVNFQREKLSSQQADLTKYDAEILYWESKEREKQFQLDFISQEMVTLSNSNRITNEQLQSLSHVEEENEIVKQQEKTLKSELTLLRSKLANCETELLQCKNKIRLVMEEMQLEQRAQMRRTESRKQIERNLFAEMERLLRDVELAKQSTELHHLTADTLKKEVAALEVAITEKKRQVEQLVGEMKAANLHSLTTAVSGAPGEEGAKQLVTPLDAVVGGGAHSRSGSTRKMIGSPRQLENAAPTSKNPHGVWV